MPRSPRWARKAPAVQVTLIAVEYARKGKVYLLGTAAVWEIEPALPKGLSSLLSLFMYSRSLSRNAPPPHCVTTQRRAVKPGRLSTLVRAVKETRLSSERIKDGTRETAEIEPTTRCATSLLGVIG